MTSNGAYRAGLAILMAAAVAVPTAVASWRRDGLSADAQIKALLVAHGARILREHSFGAESEAIAASFPACRMPVEIAVASSALEDRQDFDRRLMPKGATAFIYLGRTQPHLDHVGLWFDYLSALGRNLFRARPLANLDEVVVVASPAHCAAIDWKPIWDRTEAKVPSAAP